MLDEEVTHCMSVIKPLILMSWSDLKVIFSFILGYYNIQFITTSPWQTFKGLSAFFMVTLMLCMDKWSYSSLGPEYYLLSNISH